MTEQQIQNEADFERQVISGLRDVYLASSVAEKARNDPAWSKKVNTIIDFVGDSPQSVLDIGCNTGGEASLIQAAGHHVVAGDINDVAVDIARERCAKSGLPCPEFTCFDVHRMPFEDNRFDVVICWEVLHHFADLPRALREIHRVLRPGGRGIAYEPYAHNPYRRFSEVRHTIATRGKGIERSFTESQLSDRLTEAGLNVVSLTHSPMGLSSWKADRYPLAKRVPARLYYRMMEAFPDQLSSMLVTFEKPDVPNGHAQGAL